MSWRRAIRPVSALLVSGVAVAIPAAAQEIRSFDGTGNNLAHPKRGSAGSVLVRLLPPSYPDGVAAPAGADRPGARTVSNLCSDQRRPRPNRNQASHFLWAWGQFLDHDISLTGAADPGESFPIPVPAGDPVFDPEGAGDVRLPFVRSVHRRVRGVRQQVNQITAWIDASHVYGSDEERARALRRGGGRGDLLRTSRSPAGPFLPRNRQGLANAPDRSPELFLAGDVRANENVILTALHTVFMREHNRIVRRLRRAGGLDAEERYQMARALVAAQIQAITYREFLPALLGPDALAQYGGYDRTVEPGIANVFSTACYRFGHSMLPARLARIEADGSASAGGEIELRDAFFAPQVLVASGLESLLRGLAARRAERIDPQVVNGVRNFLFAAPGQAGLDLAAFNIQRGRDHGLPAYNEARRHLGLAAARDFADVSRDAERRRRLAEAYEDVEAVDLWVGMLAEDPVPGALLGETAFHVVRDQFERLRDGDRFWYQRALSADRVAWVERQTLARILRRNTKIGRELAADPFRVAASE